jgi:pyruvate kinase
VYSNLKNIVGHLNLISGINEQKTSSTIIEQVGFKRSKKLLKHNTNRLFQRQQKKHFADIMVTLPLEAAEDMSLIENMANNGMHIARINLSHGSNIHWLKMVENIRAVNQKTGHQIKIYMDLSGPKFRTSKIKILGNKGRPKNKIDIRVGEHIILTKRKTRGRVSKFGTNDQQIEKAEVGVLLPELIEAIKIGDVVLFDDGMISAIAVSKTEEDIELEITACYKSKLSSEKGINLPTSEYEMPALTRSDITNLPFVSEYADIVGYSFVQSKNDVAELYKHLQAHQAEHLGVVFKIETAEAFHNLPGILLEGMKHPNIGVMIARGDLAVEVGFERISEIQNEILWICEAAHTPVIWATQVLENLAKTGIPTRAEISDASLGAQSECVMLNKGPFINNAIHTLENILIRMRSHGFKRKSALRALSIAQTAVDDILEKQSMSTH